MSAPLTNRQQGLVRDCIKVRRIVEELQKHVFGERDMSQTQIRAASVLLDKSLASLTATEISTDVPALLPMLKIVPSDSAAS